MTLNLQRTREDLQSLDFQTMFVEELGWANPPRSAREPRDVAIAGIDLEERQIAELGGVVVIELKTKSDEIPGKGQRDQIQREITKQHHENLLIFTDREKTRSLWYWVKRDGTHRMPREHLYIKGQPGDLFLSKLAPMFVDISELDESGNVSVVDAARRLQQALDVQPVTRKFYDEYREEHLKFTELIEGIDDERDRRWYASVLLNRLMFVYFLQRKGFVDRGNLQYLGDKLKQMQVEGTDLYYKRFLKVLFFEGFAKPEEQRSAEAKALLGKIRYLNGGLFLPHSIEQHWKKIDVPDEAFENLIGLFRRYSWNLDDTPGGDDDEINPDVLGYIFEKYINQKAFGAYYTPPEITEYLAAGTIHRLILERINLPGIPGIARERHFESVADLLLSLDAQLCKELLFEVLPKLSILDPACGSGAFLVAAMKTLINVYSAVTGRIRFLRDASLQDWLEKTEREHARLDYYVKKQIITNNLYGVDIMQEATEIARLRLFLALVSSVDSVEQLEPLPNIDFNILAGNSLIGQLRVDPQAFDAKRAGGQYNQLGLLRKQYVQIVDEKNRLVREYRGTAKWHRDLRALRDNIDQKRREANADLNDILLDQFRAQGVKFEQATWDDANGKQGKAKKRDVRIGDIEKLQPFHWGYEFDEVMNQRGGFDVIITNPPWEILQSQEKEFFADYSDLVTKNKMRIEEFKGKKKELLKDPEIQTVWLEYESRFPYQSAYFRTAPQFANQVSMVNGKRHRSDINLYKLFTEQCFNLLRPSGECGIVIPSGIYTDLGAKQLRELLLHDTHVTGLFCFENRKHIFDNVDSRFKFVVLTFEKGKPTSVFPAAFMRHDVDELGRFPAPGALMMPVELIQRMSPDSLSIMEFKSEIDIQIAEKMLRFPLLGQPIDNTWNVSLTQELNMTTDSYLFRTEPGSGCLPLYEGKMIHQFTNMWAKPRYWVDEKEGRAAILGRKADVGQTLDYQDYRLGFRDIASNTNERTLIATVIPPTFHGNKLPTVRCTDSNGNRSIGVKEQLCICAIWDSFVLDYTLRQRVTTTVNFFYIYQLPVPRLAESQSYFGEIVKRAARLICTTTEYDDLAREVGLRSHEDGVTDPVERAKLRAELDAIIAHIYGLTEDELRHILSTFPLVDQSVKDAVIEKFSEFTPAAGDSELIELIERGESPMLEFKEDVFWDNGPANRGEKACYKSVAAFLNTDGGDLLIGVHDSGSITGLEPDFARVRNRNRRDADGWLQAVTQMLINAIGNSMMAMARVRLTMHEVDRRTVCRVHVEPASDPAWVSESNGDTLYVRAGNTTRALVGREATAYARAHW